MQICTEISKLLLTYKRLQDDSVVQLEALVGEESQLFRDLRLSPPPKEELHRMSERDCI